jgi:hypothetical protein
MFGYAMLVARCRSSCRTSSCAGGLRQGVGPRLRARQLSLKNFHFVLFEHATAAKSVLNAFLLPAPRPPPAVIITLGVAYIVRAALVPFGGMLGFLCIAPFVIPGVVLAIGFYAAYAPPPLALYGTALILILAFTTRFLPIGYVNCQRGHAQHQSRDGGGGARAGRQPADRAAPRRGAAAQAQPARRLAADLHSGDARAVVGDLPLRARAPRSSRS